MNDLFTAEEPVKSEFKDIANQRESVAEEKARLCNELNLLLRRTPNPARISTIQQVRQYKAQHKEALKACQSQRSSRQELMSAINTMRAWHPE